MSKTDKERNRIQDEFDEIQSENGEFDLSKHLARPEDLPDLGEIEIYDYDADLTVASQQSMDVLESLVDLYLGDVPQLKQHPYIKNKMKEDATVYAEGIFLTKMTRKNKNTSKNSMARTNLAFSMTLNRHMILITSSFLKGL
jgi:hypothetical protein